MNEQAAKTEQALKAAYPAIKWRVLTQNPAIADDPEMGLSNALLVYAERNKIATEFPVNAQAIDADGGLAHIHRAAVHLLAHYEREHAAH